MYGEIINNSLILNVYSFPKKNNPFDISASGQGRVVGTDLFFHLESRQIYKALICKGQYFWRV